MAEATGYIALYMGYNRGYIGIMENKMETTMLE